MPGASGTTINLVVSGVAARAVLWPDFAPKSVVALVQSLPLELPLQHCKWSGPACFAELAGGAISTIEGLETPGDLHLSLRPWRCGRRIPTCRAAN